MKHMKKKTKKIAMEAGAGVLTAAALAAAGVYLMSDKKRQRKAKEWAVKARREVAKNVGKARRMSMAQYNRIVEEATKHYKTIHGVDAREAMAVAKEMKAEWSELRKNAMKLAEMARSTGKKLARRSGSRRQSAGRSAKARHSAGSKRRKK